MKFLHLYYEKLMQTHHWCFTQQQQKAYLWAPQKPPYFIGFSIFSFGSHKKDKWKALLAIYFFYLFFFWTNPNSIIHIKYLFLNRRYFLAVFVLAKYQNIQILWKRIEQNFYERAKICHEFSIRHSFKQKQHIFSITLKKISLLGNEPTGSGRKQELSYD